MPFAFHCPECEKPMQVRDELRGKKVRCPKCKSVITAPTEEPIVAAAINP
jgi:predicted Zn finger-like uncharacterized protein